MSVCFTCLRAGSCLAPAHVQMGTFRNLHEMRHLPLTSHITSSVMVYVAQWRDEVTFQNFTFSVREVKCVGHLVHMNKVQIPKT